MLTVRHFILIGLLLPLSGFQLPPASASEPVSPVTPDIVRAIWFYTSEKTLLSLIRTHDLVKVLNAADEESAMFRLRRRTTMKMEPGGNGLVIAVEGQDPAHSAILEDFLVELWHQESIRQSENPLTLSEEELMARLGREENIVREKREDVMRIMKDLKIVDTSFLLKPSHEMIASGAAEVDVGGEAAALAKFPLEYQRARRAWVRQLEVLNINRRIAAAVSALREMEAASPGSMPTNFTPSVLEAVIRPVSPSFKVRAHSQPIPDAGSAGLIASPAKASSMGNSHFRPLWPWWILTSTLPILILLGGFWWWQWKRKRSK